MDWIKVTNQMPQNFLEVLTLNSSRNYHLSYFNGSAWCNSETKLPHALQIELWQPLPKKPD